jgi:hypothetical protein
MSNKRFPLPATGGGYPIVVAGARAVHAYDRDALTTITITLSTDAEAEANGRRVVDLIREACVAGDLERVAILHALFSSIACRVPEFHVLVHEVIERGDRAEIVKVLDLPRRGRGRRPGDTFFFTSLIEHVMEAEGFDKATQAVEWLSRHRQELDLPDDFLPGAKALLNQHAMLGEYFQLWSSSVYVKPELLTLMPPELPGVPYTPEMIEKARFPPRDGSTWPHGIVVEIRPPHREK